MQDEGELADDPRNHYRPWMRGQTMGSLKKMKVRPPRTEEPVKVDDQRQECDSILLPLTLTTLSSTPLQKFHQTGKPIEESPNIPISPSHQTIHQISPPLPMTQPTQALPPFQPNLPFLKTPLTLSNLLPPIQNQEPRSPPS